MNEQIKGANIDSEAVDAETFTYVITRLAEASRLTKEACKKSENTSISLAIDAIGVAIDVVIDTYTRPVDNLPF